MDSTALVIVDSSTALLIPSTALAEAGASADRAAASSVLHDYQIRKSPATLRRQRADLALFAAFLGAAGVKVGMLADDIDTWVGVSWGLVAGFVRWQVQQGYAIGSVNVRLATVKAYAKIGVQAGVISPEAYAMIKTVAGYRHAEGRHVDEGRDVVRIGAKKASSVLISSDLAARLKAPGNTPQARRDAVLMCLLLDHGLRVGEVAVLQVEHISVKTGTMTFYRPKVHKVQTHRLTEDTRAALRAYLKFDVSLSLGPLLLGSSKGGKLGGGMAARNITARVTVLGARLNLAGLSAHDCRHYWATAAVRAGTDIKALQDAGGWSSPAMPLRYAESASIANEGVRLS
jgi:integrase